MPKTRKKYLWRHPSGGVYFRKDKQYVRFRSAEGTREFDDEYWLLLRGADLEPVTSCRALIELYQQSDRWTQKAPRTQRDYQRVLDYLLSKIPRQDMVKMSRADVIAAQRAIAAGSEETAPSVRFANYVVQVLVVLFEEAIDQGWIPAGANPAKGVRMIKTDKSVAAEHEHVPWTDEAVEAFRSGASPVCRLLFEIGIGSVQRPADWCAFRWHHWDGEALDVTQGKTGTRLWLPATAELRTALEDHRATLPADLPPDAPIFPAPKGNGPMSYNYMSKILRKERIRLGVEKHDLHAVRYLGVQELALAGCTDDEIAAYSGHATKSMIAKYAGLARQRMRARQALEKRERHIKIRAAERSGNA